MTPRSDPTLALALVPVPVSVLALALVAVSVLALVSVRPNRRYDSSRVRACVIARARRDFAVAVWDKCGMGTDDDEYDDDEYADDVDDDDDDDDMLVMGRFCPLVDDRTATAAAAAVGGTKGPGYVYLSTGRRSTPCPSRSAEITDSQARERKVDEFVVGRGRGVEEERVVV